MKRFTGTAMVVIALFFSFILSKPVQAVEIPGLTGVQDGGAYNTDKTLGITQEGKYTLKIADTSDNSNEITFWIDRTAPIITGVENDKTYNDTRQITVNDGKNGSGIAEILLDGQNILETPYVTTFTFPAAEGTHTLIAKDKAGNSTTAITFTVQTKPVINDISLVYKGQIDEPENALFYDYWEIEATGISNGSVYNVAKENIVVTDGAGNSLDNKFSSYEDYYTPEKWLVPDIGYYRVYIKDNNGILSAYILTKWDRGGSLIKANDIAAPTINIGSPTKVSAVEGDTVDYKVTYADDLAIGAVTLQPSDVEVYHNGQKIERTVTISGSGNERIVSVPVGPESGLLGIKIKEGTAYDVDLKRVLGATGATFRVNSVPFVFENVTIYSNNQISDPNAKKYAKAGDMITLEFTTSEEVAATPTVKILGKSANVTGNGSATKWKAVYTASVNDSEGIIPFEIICNTTDNTYPLTSLTTDASKVTFDKTVPACNITDGSAFNGTSVNVKFSDAQSGIYSSFIRKDGGEANPIQNDTNFVDPGNYELTLTDFAGNINIVKFSINRIKPTIISCTPVYVGQWDDPANEEWGETYQLTATGKDANGNTFTATAQNVIVRTESGEEINNEFDWAEGYNGGSYNDPTGTFRVYIKDQAGNISDNYVTFSW